MESRLVLCLLVISGITDIQKNIAECKPDGKVSSDKLNLKAKPDEIQYSKQYKSYHGRKHKRKDSLRPKLIGESKEQKDVAISKLGVSAREDNSHFYKQAKPYHDLEQKREDRIKHILQRPPIYSKIHKQTKQRDSKTPKITKAIDKKMKGKTADKKFKQVDLAKNLGKQQTNTQDKSTGLLNPPGSQTQIKKSSLKIDDNKHKQNQHSIRPKKYKVTEKDDKYTNLVKQSTKKASKKTFKMTKKQSKKRDSIGQKQKLRHVTDNRESNTIKDQLTEALKTNEVLRNENKMLKQMVIEKPTAKPTANPRTKNEDEVANLKILLSETMAMNKRLKKQNKRHKKIRLSILRMCKLLDGLKEDKGRNTTKSAETETKPQGKNIANLHPLAVSSRVLPDGSKDFQVDFRAITYQPVSDWQASMSSGSFYRTGGKTVYRGPNNIFTTSLVASPKIFPLDRLDLNIYDAKNNFHISLNGSADFELKLQDIPPVQIIRENSDSPIVAPFNGGLNMTFFAVGNISRINEINANFNGINNSVNPLEIFSFSNYMGGINITTRTISSSRIQISIWIDGNNARHGGILFVGARMNPEHPEIFVFMSCATEFDILSYDTSTVVPPNSLAIVKLSNITLVSPPYQSISCGAMGNPRPNVTLVKDSKVLDPEVTILHDDVSAMKAYTVDASDPHAEGKYICRASTADYTLTSMTEVIIYEPPEIDKDASWAITNGSEKMVINCVASGKLTPQLGLTLYDEYGPDLARSPRYKVMRSNPAPGTSLLEVTISPVDTDIYRVYCTTLSTMPANFPAKQASLVIEVYPMPSTGPNWDLYYELLQDQNSQTDTK